MNPLIWTLIIGAVSGWLADVIRRGFGFGLLGNIVIGILGAFVGQWLFRELDVSIGSGMLNQIITSVIGALVVLFVIGLLNLGGKK